MGALNQYLDKKLIDWDPWLRGYMAIPHELSKTTGHVGQEALVESVSRARLYLQRPWAYDMITMIPDLVRYEGTR